MKTISAFGQEQAHRLIQFLTAPERPAGTLNYGELAGFLFTIAAAPEPIPASLWLSLVFNQEPAGFRDLREADAIQTDIMALYDHIDAGVVERNPQLPPGCTVRSPAITNTAKDAPLNHWARGFACGYRFLEPLWEKHTPQALKETLGASLWVLIFFVSEELAHANWQDSYENHQESLPQMAESMLELYPAAMAEYARLGRCIYETLCEQHQRA